MKRLGLLAVFAATLTAGCASNTQQDNFREASFELLLQLADLEQIVYAAYYDQDPEGGNPRNGWVKVGLIADLSLASEPVVHERAVDLRETWGAHWESLPRERASADAIVKALDATRNEVKQVLRDLN